jgi:hypothetical protein
VTFARPSWVGCTLEVIAEFATVSDPPLHLKIGQKGVVEDVDGDGDTLIDLGGQQEWVSSDDINKLKIEPLALPSSQLVYSS